MRYLYVILTISCFTGCKPDKQESRIKKNVDYKFKTKFDNCIQIVTLRQIDCREVDCVTDYWNTVYAFECLSAITGVKSNVIVGNDMPYFYPSTDTKDFTAYFYEDFVKWNNWYELNKYWINMERADSLLEVYSENVGDTIRWPQSYSLLFSSKKISSHN